MYISAVILLGVAGTLFCLAAVVYWRRIAHSKETFDKKSMAIVGAGMVALTIALILSLWDHTQRDFTFAVISLWSAAAALLFVKRFLSMPSRSLLVLPVGAMAFMIAVVSVMHLPDAPPPDYEHPSMVIMIHVLFMVIYFAANLISASAGLLYFIADRQLKRASERAFKLPSLPSLRRVTVVGLVVSCAMLLAGLATGAAAATEVEGFDYAHPIVPISIFSMVLLMALLFFDVKQRLNQKALSIAAMLILLLTIISVVSLNLHSPYA